MRRWVLRKLLTFFGRMENKLWRELYVYKPTKSVKFKHLLKFKKNYDR